MPRGPGDRDYRPAILNVCCRSYLRHADDAAVEHYKLYGSVLVTNGPSAADRQSALDKAWSEFALEKWTHQEDKEQAQKITRRVFRNLVNKWLAVHLVDPHNLKRKRQTAVKLLNDPQIDRLCELLGTPIWRDGRLQYVNNYFSVCSACLDACSHGVT